MKLRDAIPALKDPELRRLVALRAAASAALLEGMEASAQKDLEEIERIRRSIAVRTSRATARRDV